MWRIIGSVVALALGLSLVAIGHTFELCETGTYSSGFFTNYTGQPVDGLILRCTEIHEPEYAIGIGADMRISSMSSTEIVYAGFVVPNGTWEVGWAVGDFCLRSAAWTLNGEIVEEIDVHVPKARMVVYSAGRELTMTFIAAGSIDPDGFPLASFVWKFDDGTVVEGYRAIRTFTEPLEGVVALTVCDIEGKCDELREAFEVEATPSPDTTPPSVPYPYAVEVIDVSITNGSVIYDLQGDPANVLGPPSYPPTVSWCSLGDPNGWISVRMGMDFVNGAGPDLRIWEIGLPEWFDVHVSSDGVVWFLAANGIQKAGLYPPYLYVDIDVPLPGIYRYVKIVNQSLQIGMDDSPGADIDALMVLNGL